MVRRTMPGQRLEYLPWGKDSFRFKHASLRNKHTSYDYCCKCVWFGCCRYHVLLPEVSRFARFPGRSEALPSMSECFEQKLERLLSNVVKGSKDPNISSWNSILAQSGIFSYNFNQ